MATNSPARMARAARLWLSRRWRRRASVFQAKGRYVHEGYRRSSIRYSARKSHCHRKVDKSFENLLADDASAVCTDEDNAVDGQG